MLILSEFAGAAQSLGAGAILVNPWNITDMAAAIEDALTMSDQVRPLACSLPAAKPSILSSLIQVLGLTLRCLEILDSACKMDGQVGAYGAPLDW